MYAQVRTPTGPLLVLNTHLDPAAEPTCRHQELIRLLVFTARSLQHDQPLVLGGDLNARAGTADIAALALSFTRCLATLW